MTGQVNLSTPLSFLNHFEMMPGQSLQRHFEELNFQNRPVICVVNGDPVLRKDWDYKVLITDEVQFVVLPQGGGDGKLIRTVALLALSIAAPFAAAALAPTLGISSALGISVLSAGIVLGGSFLINALLPPTVPGTPDSPTASPTYSANAQGNQARLLEPIPRLYGRHILYPDFASQPFVSYEGNEQYLYQLFCLGVGEYDVEEVRIEDTTLWTPEGFTSSFADVQLEIIPPGGTVTLFPSAVISSIEVGGQELLCLNADRTVDISGNRISMSDPGDGQNLSQVSIGDQIILGVNPYNSFFREASVSSVNRRISTDSLFTGYSIWSGKSPTEGMTSGMTIRISGSDFNDGEYTVDDVESGSSFTVVESLIEEYGNTLTVVGVDADPLNGTYTVTDRASDGTWIDVDFTFPSPQNDVDVNIEALSWIGPFAANPSNSVTDKIQIDFVYPRGLFRLDDDGDMKSISVTVFIQARLIDSSGIPLSVWLDIDSFTHSDRTATPQRLTNTYYFSNGRYEFRIRRTSNKNLDNKYNSDVQWAGMRSFIPDDNTFQDVTLMAVVMRASNQLTDRSSRKFNTIQTAKVPVWDGEAWSAPQTSRSPAWAAADILRNRVYGGNIQDSRIDLQALLDLEETWSSRGDYFDGVFDTKQTLWNALSQVLLVGRTQPLLIAGQISFVRDEPKEIVRGMFTPRNIVRDSFETSHILYDEDSPDAVIMEYIDNRTWKENEVLCYLDEENQENPARIRLFGATDREQVWREGMYQCACNLYRRIFGTFKTEMEGRVLIRGDSVSVSHDLLDWGTSSEVEDWDESEKKMSVSSPMLGTEEYLSVSDRKGRMWGPVLIESFGSDKTEVYLNTEDLSLVESEQGAIPISLDLNQEPTRVIAATLETEIRKFKVISVSPEESQVMLTVTNDDPRVYEADTGEMPEEINSYGPGTLANLPTMTGLAVSQNPFGSTDSEVLLNVSWNAASGASSYIIQYSYDGLVWKTAYEGTTTSVQISLPAGEIYVRGAAIGASKGAWAFPTPASTLYGDPQFTPGSVTGVSAEVDVSGGTISISWLPANRAREYEVSIYSESMGVFDVLRLRRDTTSTSILFTSSEIVSAQGPWADILITVVPSNEYGEGTSGVLEVNSISLPSPTNFSLITPYNGREINAQWSIVNSANSYRMEIVEDSILRGSYVTTSNSILITQNSLSDAGGPWREFQIQVRAENGPLVSEYVVLNITDEAPDIPANIVSSSPSAGTVEISWDEVTGQGVQSYRVYASDTSGFTPSTANLISDENSLSVAISGLTTGETVYFIIAAIDNYYGNNEFNFSPEMSQVVS